MGNETKSIAPESEVMTKGYNPSWSEGALVPPVFGTSTYVFRTAQEGKDFFALAYGLREPKEGEVAGLIYERLNHPGLQIAEERLLLFEPGAEECAFFTSGMAAITTTCYEFLRQGDVLLHSTPLYGGTEHFMDMLRERGIIVAGFDKNDTMDEIILRVAPFGPNKLAMILVETPANPTNDLFSLKMLKEIKDYFSTEERKVILAVDNTYLGPIGQHPILYGADLVLYSATKYIGGHSDLLAGAALGSHELVRRIKNARTFLGNFATHDTCEKLLRSLETLKLRIDAHVLNAKVVAEYLSGHPKISNVRYLGNISFGDEQFDIKNEQCLTAGGMISFDVEGGEAGAFKFLDSLKLAKLAVSLGSTTSLAQHPYTMTHAGVPAEVKTKLGISESMVRFSVGIENPVDIISDIMQALEQVQV